LTTEIEAIHHEFKERYGSPRIHAELQACGQNGCVNTVAKLMRQHGIAAKSKRKFRCTTDSNHDYPVAENILDRQFEPVAVNQVWVADITYIPTREGWLYLAAVEDLYSRQIVGGSMSERMSSRLVVDALEMAVSRRLPGEGLVAHSDRGSQYASDHYQRLLEQHGITCSMSRRGDCWDNAPRESFFASLKTDTTKTICLHSRCRHPYNRPCHCLSVGAARAGELVPRSTEHQRRIRIMPRSRPRTAPPRT
jgi:putative transposase